MAGYSLNYLALAARDVEAACRFLGGSLGLERTDIALGGRAVPFFGVGRSAVALFDPYDPYLEEPQFPGVHHMALAAADPAASAAGHGLTVTAEGTGPDGRRFVVIDPQETVGIRTRFIEPLDIPSADGPVLKIDQSRQLRAPTTIVPTVRASRTISAVPSKARRPTWRSGT